jgi:predicted amidohydrolase YtcJ
VTGLLGAAEADLILHHGKIASVDARFSLHEAIAIGGERILGIGSNTDMNAYRGSGTKEVNLEGRFVMPGLMDSHAHPADACMTEFDHPIPTMERIPDVLDYIRARAGAVPPGQWIEVRQVFITRLQERRYPTRAELDAAAPRHPVLFATGPDASVNSLALKESGMDRDFKVSDGGTGFAEKDPATGELTGILRNCTRYVKVKSSRRRATPEERAARLQELFTDYNSVGITTVCDRDAGIDDLEIYQDLRTRNKLTIRVRASQHIESIGPLATIEESIRQVSRDRWFKEGTIGSASSASRPFWTAAC